MANFLNFIDEDIKAKKHYFQPCLQELKQM